MHPPIAVEAPLAHAMICACLGAHPDSARLAPTMPEFLNDTIEVLLRLAA